MPATLLKPQYSEPPVDRLVTGEELSRHPEWGPCELIRGKVIKVCRPKNEHGLIMTRLSARLSIFVERHNSGMVFTGDSGVYLERDPDTLRGPDIHFLAADRWPGPSALDKFLEIPPDLCVEIVSPSDVRRELDEKIGQYLAAGVKLVWVVDPQSRNARIHRTDGTKTVIPPTGVLSGENVLPGFELPLSDLFAVLEVKR